jgi:hypothetical protein
MRLVLSFPIEVPPAFPPGCTFHAGFPPFNKKSYLFGPPHKKDISPLRSIFYLTFGYYLANQMEHFSLT